jgi:two-component system phosphate regulon sensor histidine kinase PhoR
VKKLQFKRIGILIGIVLLITIGVQAWRIYTQFQIIRDQVANDIQLSLDNAVESYFAELAKSDIVTLTDDSFLRKEKGDSVLVTAQFKKLSIDSLESMEDLDNFFERVGKSQILSNLDDLEEGNIRSFSWNSTTQDSSHTLILIDSARNIARDTSNNLKIFMGREAADSLQNLQFLTNRIIISITRDSLDFDQINALLFAELERQNIDINYRLVHLAKGKELEASNAELRELPYHVTSRSTFLPQGQKLELYFENTAKTILKRGAVEIFTSLLFFLSIAGAFYYLYQTIKTQKEIADIKQDLISNITHEFKTPIATTLSAIEGIEQFNPENDTEKTKRYLGISKSQMLKLNQMVEKMLETATLDSDQLVLKKEPIEPEPLLRQMTMKFQTLAPEKKIELILPATCNPIVADAFHFENVLSNLLDNAIKYGGDEIRICLDQNGFHKIRIRDNGGNISSEQKNRVFEQFYRIPKGDLHDVKGFGIGLYYVQKIMEKHGGKIDLEVSKGSTIFTTYWP